MQWKNWQNIQTEKFPADIQEFRKVIQDEPLNQLYFSFDALAVIGGGTAKDLFVGAGQAIVDVKTRTGQLLDTTSDLGKAPKYIAFGLGAIALIYVLRTVKWGVKTYKNR